VSSYTFDIFVNSLYGITVSTRKDASNEYNVASASSLNNNEWHHIVYINAGSGFWLHYLYIDGTQVNYDAIDFDSIQATGNIRFGARRMNNTITDYYNGLLNDIRFLEEHPDDCYVLTEQGILALYNETTEGF